MKKSPNPPENEILESLETFDHLKKAIKSHDKKDLLDAFKGEQENDTHPPLLEHLIHSQLDTLEGMALLGDPESMKILLDVATRTTGFLAQVAECMPPLPNKSEEPDSPEAIQPKKLKDDEPQKTIEAFVEKLLNATGGNLDKIYSGTMETRSNISFVLPGLMGIYTHRLRRELNSNPAKSDPPDPEGEAERCEDEEKIQTIDHDKLGKLDFIIHCLLIKRLFSDAGNMIRKLAQHRLQWPMPVNAHRSIRHARVDELAKQIDLSGGLGLNTTEVNLGRPPSLDKSTPTGVATHLFMVLEAERESSIKSRMVAEESAEFPGVADRRSPEFGNFAQSEIFNNPDPHPDPRDEWREKASQLPPLTPEHVDKWVEASISWLQRRVAHCLLDDENLPLREGEKELRKKRIRFSGQAIEFMHIKCSGCTKTTSGLCDRCRRKSERLENLKLEYFSEEKEFRILLAEEVKKNFTKLSWPERDSNGTPESVTKRALVKAFKSLAREGGSEK